MQPSDECLVKERALWFYFSEIENGDSASESPGVVQLFQELYLALVLFTLICIFSLKMLFEQLLPSRSDHSSHVDMKILTNNCSSAFFLDFFWGVVDSQ